VVKNLPFEEAHHYFGEFEMFDDSVRQWTVIARTKCLVYVIPKSAFIKLFLDPKNRNSFLANLRDRLKAFQKAERETLDVVHKFDEV
jgi:CRP-like cAMP-binding protein